MTGAIGVCPKGVGVIGETLDDQLVRSALMYLNSEPAERLSIRQVAQANGVSHQAPYVHFGSKRRFLAAVASVGLQEATDAAIAALGDAGDDPLTRLHAFADAYMSFIQTRPHVHDLAFGPLVAKGDHPLLQQAAARHWDLLHDTVARCQPPGTGEAEILRRCVASWGTVYGIARLGALRQIPDAVPGDGVELTHQALDALYLGWQAESPDVG